MPQQYRGSLNRALNVAAATAGGAGLVVLGKYTFDQGLGYTDVGSMFGEFAAGYALGAVAARTATSKLGKFTAGCLTGCLVAPLYVAWKGGKYIAKLPFKD